jgi:type IV secretory pathway protease TraF
MRGRTGSLGGQHKPMLLIGLSAVGVLMLCVPATMASARLVWNVTASAPPGLYSIAHADARIGDRVAIQPEILLAVDLERRGILRRGKVLIKKIIAGQGDTVCRDGAYVTVNGSLVAVARSQSGSGMSLPVWLGCRTLEHADVFLLGDTADSYDGRYFGITRRDEVIGPVRLVISF